MLKVLGRTQHIVGADSDTKLAGSAMAVERFDALGSERGDGDRAFRSDLRDYVGESTLALDLDRLVLGWLSLGHGFYGRQCGTT